MTAFGMGLTALWVTAHETASSGLAIGSYGTLPIIILGIICIGLVHKAGQLGLHIGREVGLGASKAISGASSASQRSLESESSASSASSSFGSGSSSNSNSSSGSGRYTPDHSDLNKPEIKRW